MGVEEVGGGRAMALCRRDGAPVARRPGHQLIRLLHRRDYYIS